MGISILSFALLMFTWEVSCFLDVSVIKRRLCKNYENTSRWDCSSRELYNIPSLPQPQLILDLDLSHNRLKHLESRELQIYYNIEKLNLSYNLISVIHSDFFNQNPNLQILDLSFNYINSLPSKLFLNTSGLVELYVGGNHIFDLKGNVFSGLTSLKVLALNDIPFLVEFDDNFKNLKAIESLILEGSILGDINAATFKPFYNSPLSMLDISYTLIDSFKIDSLSRLSLKCLKASGLSLIITETLASTLSVLNIQNLSLDHIVSTHPEKIHSLLYSLNSHTLEMLDFSFNSLTHLDKPILRNVTNLKWLSLKGNHLIDVNFDKFVDLKYLQVLDLSQNYLKVLAKNSKTASLQFLKKLDLSHNQINILNTNFDSLHFLRLEELILNENEIDLLENDTFKNMLHLKQLFLSSAFGELNPAVDTNSFNLPSLEILDLSNNNFQKMPFLFGNATNLAILNLHNNDFGEFFHSNDSLNFLRDLNNLQVLNLSHCNITSIHQHQFQDLTSLHTLALDSNYIDDINLTVFLNLTNLANFYAAQNNLSVLGPPIIKWFDSLQLIDLSQNPFLCDCSVIAFRDWMLSPHANLLHKNETNFYKCSNKNEDILNFYLGKNDCEKRKNEFFGSVLFWTIIFVTSLIICLSAVMFVCKERLQHCCKLSYWHSKYSYHMFSGDDLLN